MTTKSANDLVAEASREVETLSAEEAPKRLGRPDTVFVDVPRGFLQFQADPASPNHRAELGSDKRLIPNCGSGNRSALAAKTLNDIGLGPIAPVAGGFFALDKAGGPIEGHHVFPGSKPERIT